MQADGVAALVGVLDGGAIVGVAPGDEEGRLGVVLVQDVEDLLGVLGGAVVKGEVDGLLPRPVILPVSIEIGVEGELLGARQSGVSATPCLSLPVTAAVINACRALPEGEGKRAAEFFAGNIGCVCEDQIYSMSRQAEFREGCLFIPIKWFAAMFLNRFVIENRGVLYITDHYGEMTWDMSELIKTYLK